MKSRTPLVMGWFELVTLTLNVRIGGCPAYAAPRTWRKSGSVSPTCVTLCMSKAAPPPSTKRRTALPCSGFIQNCGFAAVGHGRVGDKFRLAAVDPGGVGGFVGI